MTLPVTPFSDLLSIVEDAPVGTIFIFETGVWVKEDICSWSVLHSSRKASNSGWTDSAITSGILEVAKMGLPWWMY